MTPTTSTSTPGSSGRASGAGEHEQLAPGRSLLEPRLRSRLALGTPLVLGLCLGFVLPSPSMAKGAPLADGLQATPPADWARDPSANDPQTNYGKVIAAYKLPGGSYVQVRYNTCKNADQCGEMDFTADGLASDADDWSELCCTTERCGSLQSGKPQSNPPRGSSKGPAAKFACTNAMPVQPATEHLARVTRTRTGSDVIVDLTEHKVPLPRQRIAIVTVTLTSAKARYDADRAALEQFLKSFVFPKTR